MRRARILGTPCEHVLEPVQIGFEYGNGIICDDWTRYVAPGP